MGRNRARERFFQKQSKAEKASAYAQAYGAGDVSVSKTSGEYPPRDYAAERAELLRQDNLKRVNNGPT